GSARDCRRNERLGCQAKDARNCKGLCSSCRKSRGAGKGFVTIKPSHYPRRLRVGAVERNTLSATRLKAVPRVSSRPPPVSRNSLRCTLLCTVVVAVGCRATSQG